MDKGNTMSKPVDSSQSEFTQPLIAPLGLGIGANATNRIEQVAVLAQIGVGLSGITAFCDGNEMEARGHLAAAQTIRLTQINQESGTHYSNLGEAIKADAYGTVYDRGLNKAANEAKHVFKK